MTTDWYVIRPGDGRRFGPYDDAKLRQLADDGRLQPDDMVWHEGMSDWIEAVDIDGLSFELPVPPTRTTTMPPATGSAKPDPVYRIAAGICGITLGSLGIHKFIYGATTPGIIMLLVTLLTCGWGGLIMGTIGIIEGIIYLTKTDAEFEQTYMIDKKPWF